MNLKALPSQLKSVPLRFYYLILFYYHMRMYKKAVNEAERKGRLDSVTGD
jgi:hypothetical protein